MNYGELLGKIIGVIIAIIGFYVGYKQTVKRKESGEKEKKNEWVRLILIIVGFIVIPITILSFDYNYAGYAILAIFIWIILVWFILPIIYKKLKQKR